MDCEGTREKLNAYLDGELSSEGAFLVREHLQDCPRCAAELDELKRLNQALDAYQGIGVPEGFARRVVPAPTPVGARPLPVRVFSRAAAVLMAVAGLSVGLAMGGSVGPADSYAAQAEGAELDDFDLQAEVLSGVDADSVADAYLELLSEGE
ncbi:MAG: anti-sigma factor family protein [Planctomycetota bacterium]